jgi:oligoribonuclease
MGPVLSMRGRSDLLESAPMACDLENLIWIDLEMTGLDTAADHILEVATVVTNKQLDVLSEGPVLAIHQSDEVLAAMDTWNTRTHTQSGLVARVRASRFDYAEAERRTLEFLAPLVPPGASPMCGNSICQDRRFLSRLMPSLERYFHYRNRAALDARGCGALRQGEPACRARGHPRVHTGAALLPRAALPVAGLDRRPASPIHLEA